MKTTKPESAYYDLCSACGNTLYPNADKSKMNGITVHSGNCDRCGDKSTMIPVRDWEYASNPNASSAEWD